ncbi:MAG: hypothetical protein GTO51_01370 [Candidatus Latescibacteria bacterium]|nr:hypothetical protein [Candidatus Latescibacterota bacterium]NIM21650.1 hypothetical protein [Candidatus Latescibacterota bacterium]NIM64629.1 hypothetical protein [Candidatus Latescibacterota bacterium]NIO01144.1 hypothetical protein [Candidatus Latescibacterota bacterium]NIO27537.1 hypothetical protein [Candidatus Latescibacterota bacterium]
MKVLVIRFSSLGDCVLLCPFLSHLKAQGASDVTIVTKAQNVELFSAVPGVDRVVGLGKNGGMRGLIQIAISYKSRDYVVIDAHNNWRSRFLSRQLGGASARIRKYYGARVGLILFKWRADIPSVKERYSDLGRFLSLPAMHGDQGQLELPASVEQRVSEILAPYEGDFIAVAPGSRWPMKRWPEDRYTELLKRICDQHGFNVMLLGDDTDEAVSLAIEWAIGPKVLNLTGRTGILEAAGFIERSICFIGNDSGLMHLAEIMKVPVIALFGPTVEAFGYYPSLPESKVCERNLSCRPCSRNGSRWCFKGTQECLREIPVDAVEGAFHDLLRGEGPRRYVLP